MKIDEKLVKPTLNGIFSNYFRPSGHPNCYLLPNGLEFSVFASGDDVICDFGSVGWMDIRAQRCLFIPVENQLKGYVIRGEVVLRYRTIRDAKIPSLAEGD